MPFTDENDIPASCSASNINAKPAQTLMGLVSTDIDYILTNYSAQWYWEEITNRIARVHAPTQKVLLDGVQTLRTLFFIKYFEGRREDPNNTKSRPSSAHQ